MNEVPLDLTRPGSRAVVVFSGESDLMILRLLKPGFRHCCALIEAGKYWVFYNPTSRGTEIAVFKGLTIDLIVSWFTGNGHVVVCSRVADAPPCLAPIRAFSCVEAVKRVMGIHAPWVLTPWQLFTRLVAVAGGGSNGQI